MRKAVIAQEKKVKPDNAAFAKAINHVKRSTVKRAKRATQKLIDDATAYRAALLKQNASSAKVAKGPQGASPESPELATRLRGPLPLERIDPEGLAERSAG